METMSPNIAELATALAKAQAAMKGAAKDSTNPHFKNRYADLASIWDACRGPLTANGLAVIQTTTGDGAKVVVRTVLAHSSGQWIAGDLTMTAQQNTPQAVGSCITYARRYALAAMVGVAPDDDDDAEAAERPAVQSRSAPRAVPPPTETEEVLEQARQVETGSGRRGTLLVPFGKWKGKPLSATPLVQLEWLAGAVAQSIDDPGKEQYRANNVELLAAIESEMRRKNNVNGEARQ